jgi:tRNA-modifying protein YgfZ
MPEKRMSTEDGHMADQSHDAGTNGWRSPALNFDGAVPGPPGSPDAAVPWHYGDPHGEQRRLARGEGAVDQSNLAVLTITGSDRLSWLHSLTTADVASMTPGSSATALILDPHGHVEHELHVVDDGSTSWLIVEPDSAQPLRDYLERMRFMLDVEISDVTDDWAVVWLPRREVQPDHVTWLIAAEFAGEGWTPAGSDKGGDAHKYHANRPEVFPGSQVLVPRSHLEHYLNEHGPLAGIWALEALRTAAAVPRLGWETDYKTLPHEVGWIGPAVHLAKGCYRGQETVARVHNMGRPPRKLVLLHLDGSQEELPESGSEVSADGRVVGWIATTARHFELGPIATAVLKRSVGTDTVLELADGSRATIEPVVGS